MKYFSGFSFKNEQELFSEFLIDEEFVVAGFSYGAQKAIEYVYSSNQRVNLLQLISPAYFNDKDIKFKRLQTLFFKKDKSQYQKNFLSNTLYPSNIDISKYIVDITLDDLESLLYYEWDKDKLKSISKRGTKIEVYLGDIDRVISYKESREFFIEDATIFTIKNSGHILRQSCFKKD
jgi:predicted alpha/beta hydrolase family esterase